MKFSNIDGWGVFSELNVPKNGGVKAEYFCTQKELWLPCCLFSTLDEDALFAPNNNQDWNWATTFTGIVMQYNMTADEVFWNYYISFDGLPPEREVKVRLTVFGVSGKDAEITEMTVCPEPGDIVFLNNWTQWKGAEAINSYDNMEPNRHKDPEDAPEGWCVADCPFGQPRLTIFGKKAVEPLYHSPGLTGKYDLYLCVKEHILECDLELPGQTSLTKFQINPRIMPFNKFWKEIYVGQYNFDKNARIGIHQSSSTIHNPLRRFGDLYYFKMVPAKRPARPEPLPFADKVKEIIFYSEPYSVAYYYSLQNEKMVEQLVNEYSALGVDKVFCQMGRVGSIMLYPSKVAAPARLGFMSGDDKQSSNGVNEMMQNMDILEVLSRMCRKRGIKFIPNIGVNMPYIGSTLETKFSDEHPECRQPARKLYMDYSRPEILDFAAEHFVEMAQYDIDGVGVDHQRYPYGQTTETVVALHRKIVEKIGAKRRSELEINIRFQADNPDYFEAVKVLMEENLVDGFIPSRLFSVFPIVNIAEYVKLGKRYNKKVYGCLDGWSWTYTDVNQGLIPRPKDFEEAASSYIGQDADGLFFYQSEQILKNVFSRRFVQSLKIK
jgi:hypothetical protein